MGAGPVGLALALAVAREGRSVLVIEENPGTSEHSRAPAIWPRTQEILADLDVLSSFLREGIALREVSLHDADRGAALIRFPLGELAGETDHPQLLILPQSDTERLLCDAVRQQPAAEVRFSYELVGLDAEEDRVVLTCRRGDDVHREEARFVAGCDGGHSRVREAIGASLEGMTYDARAALADVRLSDGDDLPFPRLTTRPKLAVGIRLGDRLWRLILPITGGEEPLPWRVARTVESLFPGCAYEPVWSSEFRLHRRVSSRFTAGRVALAGDAAHLNSPVGGQGMNAGIQDVAVLAPALRQALRTDTTEPLARYERQRRPEVERGVNRFTDVLTRLVFAGGGRMIRPVLRSAALVLRAAPARHAFLRRAAMLDAARDA